MTYIKIQGILTLLIFCIDFIWMASSPSLSFFYNEKDIFLFTVLLVFLSTLCFFYKKIRPDPRLHTVLISTVFLISYTALALILSYLACTVSQPLVNSTLSALDGGLGFDFLSLYYWFQEHQWWNTIFVFIYNSILLQILFIVLYFGFIGNIVYLQRFIMLFMISILPTILIAAFFPAVATFVWYHYPPDEVQLRAFLHFSELRVNILNIQDGDGIIEFPSFHATLAMIFIYTFRHENKIIFVSFLILNILMIFSCLSQGAHYLVDILGGIAVFAFVAVIENYLFRRVGLQKSQLSEKEERQKSYA